VRQKEQYKKIGIKNKTPNQQNAAGTPQILKNSPLRQKNLKTAQPNNLKFD
jgi:hypothetical protein